MRAETETMQEDIRGFSLASLAEITAEGRFLKAGFSAIHNGADLFHADLRLHLFHHTSDSL